MAPQDEPLGSLLKGLRKDQGQGLAQAAQAAGLGRSTLYQWETGLRTPRGAALERLLDALGTPERLRSEALARADPRHARIALADRPLGRPVEVGGVLRAMRLRRGLTQAEAAEVAGLARGTLARWEGGDAPDAASLHAVAFALGAAPEEAVALSLAGGGAGDAPATPEDAVYASIAVQDGEASLHEVLQLAIEAHAWRRSMRDPRWDVAVTSAMAKRAARYFLEGRLPEAEATAREAVRRARRPEARSEAVMALDTLEVLSRRRGAPPAPAVRLAEAWAASIPLGPTPEGGSKAWAAKIAARARATAGDLEGALATARDIPAWLAREFSGGYLDHMVRFEATAVLLAGGAPDRALALLRPEDATLGGRLLDAAILLANREPLPTALLGALRADAPSAVPVAQVAIARVERSLAEPDHPPALPFFY